MGSKEDGGLPDLIYPPRLPDWRPRLDTLIRAANLRPWQWGTGGPGEPHDCLALVGRTIEAVLGVDLYAPYLGRYNDEKSASLIAPDVETFMFELAEAQGWPVQPVNSARDGDLVLVDLKPCMAGVVYGGIVFPKSPAGLRRFPRSFATVSWALGDG